LLLPLLAPLAWIEVALLGRFALAALCVVHIAVDIRAHPGFTVMKYGWVLVALWMGPIAAARFSPRAPGTGAPQAESGACVRCG
jgi:hypothetical protein